MSSETFSIAITGDLHAGATPPGALRAEFASVDDEAELLLIAGDLTDHGSLEEAELLGAELANLRLPKVAVLGNHDHEHGEAEELMRALTRMGIRVLDGDLALFGERVAIAGAKGFCGGFGRAALQPWGEEVIKSFVLEAVNEALKLEAALARAQAYPVRVALTHYAPIKSTVEGENPEVLPFLGSSRLADAIEQFGATLAVHGHAHNGHLEGTTAGGIPVYNAAATLLRSRFGRAYRVVRVGR